jgi:hypothetical protein
MLHSPTFVHDARCASAHNEYFFNIKGNKLDSTAGGINLYSQFYNAVPCSEGL